MEPFLKTVARQLIFRHQKQLHRLAVVFPNRRQGIFFLHYLQELLDTPTILPEILTIESLVQQSSPLAIADQLIQNFLLYDAFIQVSVAQGDSLESLPALDVFYPLGETLLLDFQELDHYLVDVDKVYAVMRDMEAIDKLFHFLTEEQRQFLATFWEASAHRTSIQEKFIKLWQRLPAIYRKFHQLLAERQLTTLSMASRQLAVGNSTRSNFDTAWDYITFIGFNALNKCEEQFLMHWQKIGKATFWMDADKYYADHQLEAAKRQEAGLFLRRNIYVTGLVNEMPLLDVIENRTDAIKVTAVNGHIAQAKMVADWITHLPEGTHSLRAAILLADESLLLPVLQSLPEGAPSINVTMGYPLAQSQVYSFIKLFFLLKQQLVDNNGTWVGWQVVHQWLQHPFCDWTEAAASDLSTKIKNDWLVEVPVSMLLAQNSAAQPMFVFVKKPLDVLLQLSNCLEALLSNAVVITDKLSNGLLQAAWQSLRQMIPFYELLNGRIDIPFLGRSVLKQLGGLSIPFAGEPLEGLQIMGLLESRGLDFDHILVLGAHEGSLPRISPSNSYLPENVRKAFGLPVLDQQDAIFAYVFYRLLHRTKQLNVVYNALVTDTSTGELSRFVRQVGFETRINTPEQTIDWPNEPIPSTAIVVAKDAEVKKKLLQYLTPHQVKTLSPSAINTWLTCKLQFYFKYVAELKEAEAMQEGVDPAVFGTVVHALMQLLYEQVLIKQGNNLIEKESIEWMSSQIEVLIDQAFRQGWHNPGEGNQLHFTGELLVVKSIVAQYAHGFLAADKAYVPFRLIALETKLSEPFSIEVNDMPTSLHLTGYIDRIDEKEGVYRMVDYKTGNDDPILVSIEGLFAEESRGHNKAVLQTLLYSWMFNSKFPEKSKFEPTLLALRKMQINPNGTYLQFRKSKKNITHLEIGAVLNEVDIHLKNILAQIFDEETDFTQTKTLATCSHCSFKTICSRN